MKRFLKISAVVLLALVLQMCVFAASDVTVTLNGQKVDCAVYGQEPVIVEGRTLVPLRAVFEAIGAKVEWDEKAQTVTSERADITVKFTIGEKAIYRNGEKIEIDVPSQIMNDRTMIPVRAVASAFGIDVNWDDASRTVILTFDTYFKGFVSDNVFHGEWAGLDFVLPEGFSFEKESSTNEFSAKDEEENSVSLSVEDNTDKKTCDEFLKFAGKVYGNVGAHYEMSKIYDSKIAGVTVRAVDIKVTYRGVDLVQSVAVYEKDGKMVSAIFTCRDMSKLKVMLGGFKEFASVDKYVKTEKPETEESKEEKISDIDDKRAEKLVPVFGEFSLGMSMKDAVDKIKGETKISDNKVGIWDVDGVFEDEDRKIVGENVNCDYISLEFGENGLELIYVSSEYSDKETAFSVLESVLEHFGDGFVSGTQNVGYTWIFEDYTVYAEVAYETAEGKYYCFIFFEANE